MEQIGKLFDLGFESEGIYAFGEGSVLLRMQVTFTARSAGRSVRLRVIELLEVVDRRVRRSEVFLADTAALLETLQ